MEFTKFKMTTLDGSVRAGTVWKSDIESKGIVVLVHGMNEYIERYDDFAKFLNRNGYDVYGLDHVGHGDNSVDGLGVWDKESFKQCVKNVHTEIEHLRAASKPIYLIGHSMGSFVVQYYFEKYSRELHIKKAILVGTSGNQFKFKLANLVASFHAKFHKASKPSKFLNTLSFCTFNNRVPKNERKTRYDWICSNKEVIEKYSKDPLCTFVPSVGFFHSFYYHLNRIYIKKRLEWVDKNLPILIMGGDKDPVGNYAKGLHALQAMYGKYGLNSSLIVYEGMRHEILNEIGKEKVYEDILNFIEK